MEIEGLKRMLKCLQDDWHLMIGTLITDRHAQITKWVAENKAEITHLYDIWHVAKCKLQGRQNTLGNRRPINCIHS